MQLAEYAVYGGDPHTRPAAAQAAVQLAPRAPASQLNPPPPHVSSTGGGAGGGGDSGDGGNSGDGGGCGGGDGGGGGGDGAGASHAQKRTAVL